MKNLGLCIFINSDFVLEMVQCELDLGNFVEFVITNFIFLLCILF